MHSRAGIHSHQSVVTVVRASLPVRPSVTALFCDVANVRASVSHFTFSAVRIINLCKIPIISPSYYEKRTFALVLAILKKYRLDLFQSFSSAIFARTLKFRRLK